MVRCLITGPNCWELKAFYNYFAACMNQEGCSLSIVNAIHTARRFRLSSSVQVFPLDVTTPCDSYAWNYRELATLLT